MTRKKRTIIDETLPPEDTRLETEAADSLITLYKLYRIANGTKSFCTQSDDKPDEITIQAQYPSGGKFAIVALNEVGLPVYTDHVDIEPKPLLTSGNQGNPADIQTRLLMDEIQWTRQMLMTMLNNRGNDQTPVGELVQAMQGLNTMAVKSDPLELVLKGMELAAKFNNGASPDWKSEAIHKIGEIAQPVLETLAQIRQQQQPIGAPPMILPANLIQQGIDWIKPQIMSGLSPESAVEWLVANAGNPMYRPLISKAINETIDDFIQIDSELANEPYKSWFSTAMEMLKESYATNTEQSDASDSGPDNDRGIGDSTDSAVNEKTRTRKPKLSKVV